MENGSVDTEDNDEILYKEFVSVHEKQLLSLSIPQSKWRILHYKLSESIFDAGNDFAYSQEVFVDDPEEKKNSDSYHWRVYTKCSMDPNDDEHIYLIDHAWTYTYENARKSLMENEKLIDRMCSIMNISNESRPVNDIIDDILNEMWKYNNSYSVYSTNREHEVTRCWFIMDEFGSRINHADEPTFEVVPFFYSDELLMYSLLFPKINVDVGEEVTCRFPRLRNTMSEDMQRALKFPWEPCDLSDVTFAQSEPDEDYFKSGRRLENLPKVEEVLPPVIDEEKITVYTEYPEVAEFLTHPRFRIVSEKKDARVLWLSELLYDYKNLIDTYPLRPYVNQFPSEQVIINKDLLAIVCRRSCAPDEMFDMNTLRSNPKWLPTTFSLLIELPQFISYFQNREKRHLDNIWICKPFNMARGLEIHITDNLVRILRLSEARPMVACKYISDPVLFPVEDIGLVKMDIRYIVLLKSVHPLELYVYDRFWLRFANKPFSLDHFDDYEKHFTVMNYSNFPLQQMYCHDFIEKFEDHYSCFKWSDIEKNIYGMIKEIFVAATSKEPPSGIGSFPYSRAMYGLDIMLEWDRSDDLPQINPVILEVNWMPDCKRACQYYSEFYNDVFGVLFLEEPVEGKHVVKL
ncbi:tubulin--tyrosine ligase-like protein 12 isoform X1 [Stegodyphus dumicola]|uniref:tubulin--tyrosine ligase-like protein 12 isoform X1 n=1 Tax=Stegodyphus dumicola TaxID=202533 RepID=UPI0015AD12A2|nr:tubulin--tyrosine ligase-like protein 12 isoform X1 [Stegodyphus dumicola]